MTSFPRSVRPRHIFTVGEIPVWQGFLKQRADDVGWLVSEHAYDNIRRGRVDLAAIERLKNLDNWYVWALELGTEDTYLRDARPKFLVRYPSPDFDKWQLGGAVAVGERILIVTVFPNYDLVFR